MIFGDFWTICAKSVPFVLASFRSLNGDPCDPTGGQSSCRCCRNCGEDLSFDLKIDHIFALFCRYLKLVLGCTWVNNGEYWT